MTRSKPNRIKLTGGNQNLQAPLTFGFINNQFPRAANKDDILYRNTQNNHIVFEITAPLLTGSETIVIPHGEPVSEDGDNPVGLYIYHLSEIISSERIQDITFGPDWNYRYFPDSGDGSYYALRPKSDVILTAQNKTHRITGIHIPLEGGTGTNSTSVDVEYDGLVGVDGDGYNFSVSVLNPPSPARTSLHDLLEFGFVGNNPARITLSDPNENLENSFEFYLRKKPGVNASILFGPDTLITVFFVTSPPPGSPGNSAIASRQTIHDFYKLTFSGNPDSSWVVTPFLDEPNPYWKLSMDPGHEIIGPGVNEVVLEFYGVVSHLNPGTSLMSIHFQNVPGYDDACFRLPILKIARVQIPIFHAEPNMVVPPYDPSTLSWEVLGAAFVSLQAIDSDVLGNNGQPIDVQLQGHRKVVVSERTDFELNARAETQNNGTAHGQGTHPNQKIKRTTIRIYIAKETE